MKKLERGFYIVIIIVLVGVLASGATYMYMNNKEDDNKTNNSGTNNENVNGGNSNNSENNNDSSVLSLTKNFDLNLNGKNISFEVVFNATRTDYHDSESYFVRGVIKKFKSNNNNYYLDGILEKELDICVYDKEIYIHGDETFDLNKTTSDFNEKNFITIKGIDNKDYLAITFDGDFSDTLKIYNDEMTLLTRGIDPTYENGLFVGYSDGFRIDRYYPIDDQLENNAKPHYKRNFNGENNDENVYVKIENNKIYYLMLRFNEIDPIDDGVLEERVYTINNNELEYKILNTYKVLTFAGN